MSLLLLAASAALFPSCEWDGHFTLLGYTTRPNYDTDIKTIRVPIFKNLLVQDSARRGMEMELTRAVIREIELKTPYKVVGENEPADTELLGTILSYNKAILNRNQLNEVREAETSLTVEIVWKDLRTGDILTRPIQGSVRPAIPSMPGVLTTPQGVGPIGPPPPPPTIAPDVTAPPPDAPPGPPPPVLVQSIAHFRPELGESIRYAEMQNINRLAVNIVSMMEKPW